MSTMRDVVLIMKDVSQITAGLVKCQVEHIARVYKDILTNLLTWSLMILVAIIFAMGGLALIVFSIYAYLSRYLNPGTSAIILGTVLILIAVIIFLLAKNKLKE